MHYVMQGAVASEQRERTHAYCVGCEEDVERGEEPAPQGFQGDDAGSCHLGNSGSGNGRDQQKRLAE